MLFRGSPARPAPRSCNAGRISASLGYASVDEILGGDVVKYLRGIQQQCQAIHSTIYHLYVDYSIQAALAG
jgi:hypothetical protein